jgi:outer membrane protein assembly factor BamB
LFLGAQSMPTQSIEIERPTTMIMSRRVLIACMTLLCVAICVSSGRGEHTADLVTQSGIQGGLIVHVGCGDGQRTAALRKDPRFVVQGLETDVAQVARARALLRSKGLTGVVSVIPWNGERLPYAENMVNLLVVDQLLSLSDEEIQRVLAPGGVALVQSDGDYRRFEKPWPAEIDQWTHFLHGPDNNAVARDTQVQPPRYLQWVSGPRWGRSHDHLSGVSAVVSAAGRLFAIVDEGPIASVKAESKWVLVARDAFNGVLLWKKPIPCWEHQLRPFRSGPAELPRRLVAVGDRVYVTLGYGQPATALDAATGEVIRTYQETENTHEIVCADGKLFLVISEPLGGESPTTGEVVRQFPVWRGFYSEYVTRYMPKRVRVVDAGSGQLLWEKDDPEVTEILPLTLVVSDGKVFFQNADHLIALDAASGEVMWKAARPTTRRRYAWLTPTLVVQDGVVLSADRLADRPVDTGGTDDTSIEWRVSANHILTDGQLLAFAAADGRPLWTAPCHEGFNAPADVFVVGGRVYTGVSAWGKQPGITKVHDLHTGEVVATRPPDQENYTLGFGHHRCYRNKATVNYVIQGRAGVEFLSLDDPHDVDVAHWVRGACQYGTLPCNGLVYAPTHPCACYITAKLSGFNALSGRRGAPAPDAAELRQVGPALGSLPERSTSASPHDWPTYRQNNARSGATDAALAPELTPDWQRPMPGPLSAVVVAEQRLYVAQREAHTVHALNAGDGSSLWCFTAGGRVDSPPTVDSGRVYFGSADGWMYCLRAEDGELVWRFRVAPEARQIVSYGQLESVWPVHGNVLVCDGPNGRRTAYAAAGRSSYVDGGLHLCAVDAATGQLRFRKRISHRDPVTGREPQDLVRGVNMPGAMPDVLARQGDSIFMRHQRFDLNGDPLEQDVDHLFSSAGFLDDTWWHRTYLQIGQSMSGGYGGWGRAGNTHISGKALVRSGGRAFGFGRKQYTVTGSHLGLQSEFHLFAADIEQASDAAAASRRRGEASNTKYVWSQAIPFYPRAMVLAGPTLFLAGPCKVTDFENAHPESDVWLWAVAADDGQRLAQYRLTASPVSDSFAVSRERLYFSTVDGRVIGFGAK